MKQYYVVNQEPNVNILGLDPIIRAFSDDKMEALAGRRLKVFVYELENDAFRAIADKEDWLSFGDYIFARMGADRGYVDVVRQELEASGSRLYQLCADALSMMKEGGLSADEMRKRIIKIFRFFTDICVPGLLAPMVEMGSGGATKKIKEILDNKDLSAVGLSGPECLAILVAPTKTTWTEEFREALYTAAQKIYERKESPDKLSEDSQRELVNFVEKFGWVYYGYRGPKYGLNNAIDDLKIIFDKGRTPRESLLEIKNKFAEQVSKQNAIMDKLSFTDEEKFYISIAQDFGYTKAYRANLMALANYTINAMLAVFARQEGYSMKQVGVCTAREIEAYLLGRAGLPDVDTLNERLKYAVWISDKEKDVVLTGEEARRWIEENVEVEEVDPDMRESFGTVACTGGKKIVKGVVKVVLSLSDVGIIQPGEIMLSTNTIPDHVPAMRKSAAVVTQTGGLTCHAAIVSRELDKPCIVGVKNLMKFLKNGDEVEVDLVKGVVRKIGGG